MIALQATRTASNGNHYPVFQADVGIEPWLKDSAGALPAKGLGQTLSRRPVEEEDVSTLVAHAASKALEHFDREFWDGTLLQPLLSMCRKHMSYLS
jgi:hypothetical protein